MTFQQLTYVVEISKCGSINKAAHKLLLSQSGISTAVRELEEELGIQFFVRSSHGVDFTPEGKEFLGYAVSLLEQKQHIEQLYSDHHANTIPARFSVSSQRYSFSEDAFLHMVQSLPDNHYRLSSKETGMHEVIDDVYNHRADIGVIAITELSEKLIRRLLDARDLEFREIVAVPPCVYVRKGHPLTRTSHLTDADLEGFPYVYFEHAQGVAADFSEEYPIAPIRHPDRCINVNSRASIMRILSSTDAYTTGSGLLTDLPLSQHVVTLPLEGKSLIHIGWIFPKGSTPSALTNQYLRLLKQSIEEAICFSESQRHLCKQESSQF